MNDVNITWKGFKFNLHSASIYYLGGVDPKLQWDVRGISGHGDTAGDRQLLNTQMQNAAKNLLSSDESKRKVQKFIDEVGFVMDGIFSQGQKFVYNYLGKREFSFVIGAMRTGGTYLYKELCEIYGQPWRALNLEMTHDAIPTYGLLSNTKHLNMTLMLGFEIAQFLVWLKWEINASRVIQKRIAYAHALPILDGLFGDNAEYILTLRHPVPLGYSFARLENQNARDQQCKEPPGWYNLVVNGGKAISQSEWQCLSYFQKVAHYWEQYYLDVAQAGAFKERLIAVVFGPQMDDFLSTCAHSNNKVDYHISGLNTNTQELHDEIALDELEKCFSSVRQRWQAHGMSFPDVSLL